METKSGSFYDYVFKDGRLVGKFEEMYQKATDVPWHQDNVPNEFDVRLLKHVASLKAPYATILDVGCGLGYLAGELTGMARQVYGIDVSPTAIKKATTTFPYVQVRVLDITLGRAADGDLFPHVGAFHLVVCRGLFWYVFPHMSQVVRNVTSWVEPQGFLLIHQNFPPLDADFIGKDVIPTPNRLLQYFLEQGCFTLLYENSFYDYSKGKGNDNWSTFFLKKTIIFR